MDQGRQFQFLSETKKAYGNHLHKNDIPRRMARWNAFTISWRRQSRVRSTSHCKCFEANSLISQFVKFFLLIGQVFAALNGSYPKCQENSHHEQSYWFMILGICAAWKEDCGGTHVWQDIVVISGSASDEWRTTLLDLKESNILMIRAWRGI